MAFSSLFFHPSEDQEFEILGFRNKISDPKNADHSPDWDMRAYSIAFIAFLILLSSSFLVFAHSLSFLSSLSLV